MSVAVETSEPFSEIEREVRKLERLLHCKTTEVETYRRQSTSREQVNRCHNLCGAAVRGRSCVMSVVKALSRANQPPARRCAARSTNKREVSMRKLVVLGGGRRCSADA